MNTPTNTPSWLEAATIYPKPTGEDSLTLYPQPDEQLGVLTSKGNSHPFDGSEADWFALKSACEMRDALQSEVATLRAENERMRHAIATCRGAMLWRVPPSDPSWETSGAALNSTKKD